MIDPTNPNYRNTPASPERPSYEYKPIWRDCAPLVTIVTPFFNTGEIFRETAETVFRQSLQQWEWLIVNNGSTQPASLEILDAFRRSEDPRIRVIDLPRNGGPGVARNAGFEHARAQYVFTLDSDDLIEPTALEKLFWHLESFPEYDFVHGYSVGFGAQEYLWTNGYHNREMFLQQNLATGRSMVRTRACRRAGGYDPQIRDGFEDWDFWLRLADKGMWGATIPEYLDWYRRRENHSHAWSTWDIGHRQEEFRKRLRKKYPRLVRGEFPRVCPAWPQPYDTIPQNLPGDNALVKNKPRLLMIVPWFAMGGSDKFTLDVVAQMSRRGWEVSLASTNNGDTSWLPEFARHTPDIFVLHNFLKQVDFPRFLHYLIRSRRPDVVLLTQSELGYLLLPYLRSICPEPAYVDYTHMEETYWKNGGYPRYAAGSQSLLELNIVSSRHLEQWVTSRGGDPSRIEVCYTNIDPDTWRPSDEDRLRVRKEFGIHPRTVAILYAGRICTQKQPRVFARVMDELARHKLDFCALVAGDGENRDWLESTIAKQGLQQRVRMLGAVSNDRVRQLMSASDIFFLPSLWEGIALSIFEAMAMQLAVVGADVGGQTELVTGDCGLLHPRGSEDEEVERYAASLSRLIDDPEGCRAMGRNARKRICERFHIDQMGQRMTELLDRAVRLRSEMPRMPIDPLFGLECTTRAIEFMRLQNLCDHLWTERMQVQGKAVVAPEEEPRLSIEKQRLPSVESELRIVENCISWRFYQGLQKNPFYRLLITMRLARKWEPSPPEDPPERRLARIVSTRYFQWVLIMRRAPFYRPLRGLARLLAGRPATPPQVPDPGSKAARSMP